MSFSAISCKEKTKLVRNSNSVEKRLMIMRARGVTGCFWSHGSSAAFGESLEEEKEALALALALEAPY